MVLKRFCCLDSGRDPPHYIAQLEGGLIEVFFLSLKVPIVCKGQNSHYDCTCTDLCKSNSPEGAHNLTYSPSLSEFPLPCCIPMSSPISAVRLGYF